MKQILFAIFSGKFKNIIGFKGWTLAYLHYHLPRFSTDLDLDLLDTTREKEIIEYFDSLLVGLWNTEKRVGKELHRWKFRYDPQGWIIKIELNKRKNIFTEYEWIDIDGHAIQVQTSTSMVTNKLQALGNRRYNRDLFDIHFFLSQGYEFNENIIKDKTNMSLNEWINYIIENIPSHFAENMILHQLGEVLEEKQKPRVKNHLADETITLLQEYVDKISH